MGCAFSSSARRWIARKGAGRARAIPAARRRPQQVGSTTGGEAVPITREGGSLMNAHAQPHLVSCVGQLVVLALLATLALPGQYTPSASAACPRTNPECGIPS